MSVSNVDANEASDFSRALFQIEQEHRAGHFGLAKKQLDALWRTSTQQERAQLTPWRHRFSPDPFVIALLVFCFSLLTTVVVVAARVSL